MEQPITNGTNGTNLTAVAGAKAPAGGWKVNRWSDKEWKRNHRKVTPVSVSLNLPKRAVLDDPARLFKHITEATCPWGQESKYYRRMLGALGFNRDRHGNWYQAIGDSRTCFMAHLDTADSTMQAVNHKEKGDWLGTDGTTILGADDRAGVTVLLSLAHRKKPGHYYLFVGEESGCIGSRKAAKDGMLPSGITQAVSFDRKDFDSVITFQSGSRCCSETYAKALAAELVDLTNTEWKPDPSGLYTDSDQFTQTVPEATNISVGYQGAHSNQEKQHLPFLGLLVEAAYKLDWEGLPIERDPTVYESRYHAGNGYGGYSYQYGWDDEGDCDYAGSYWGSQSKQIAMTGAERAAEIAVRLAKKLREGEIPTRSDLYQIAELPSHQAVDCLEELFLEWQMG